MFFALHAKDPIPLSPTTNLRVAILTTFVPSKEPIEVLEKTLRAMKAIIYAGTVDVWVLDEGNDPAVIRLAQNLAVFHFSRKGYPQFNQPSGEFKAKSKAGNHNSWRALYENAYDVVAQMDPDHTPFPNFLERTLGYFRDPDIAFVVAPQVYGNLETNRLTKAAAAQAFVFHGLIQRGGNGLGAPLLIGTNHLYRPRAWKQIRGYQDSIIEDHLTSITIQGAKNPATGNQWKGVYTPDILSVGECKCYHESEPLADPKVSHWPQQSAILERKFERAEGKKGVSRGTSRRNSHLGLDPGQKPARSSPALWALAQHRCQAAPGGAGSERPSVSTPGPAQDASAGCSPAVYRGLAQRE